MLYNNGNQFNQIYYKGKPVSQIWKNGKCIYPTIHKDIAIMTGFLFPSSEIRSTITAILRSSNPPDENINAVDVSGSVSGYDSDDNLITIDSSHPIHMWIDGTVMYWYCVLPNIKIVNLGYKSDYRDAKVFQYYLSLTNISGLSDWDINWISRVFYRLASPQYANNMKYLFVGNDSLLDISPLYNWDTSNITDINTAFGGCNGFISTPLLKWNLSNVTDIGGLFQVCSNLKIADFSIYPKYNLPEPYSLFAVCSKLEKCDMGSIFNSTGPLTFLSCPKLSVLVIRNIDRMITRNLSDELSHISSNHGAIYVPQSQIDNYLSDTGWSMLVNSGAKILPLEGSPYEQPGSVSGIYS